MQKRSSSRFAAVAAALLVVAAVVAIVATFDHKRKNTRYRKATLRHQLCERWGGPCGPDPKDIENAWNARERGYVVMFSGALIVASGFTGAALARRRQ